MLIRHIPMTCNDYNDTCCALYYVIDKRFTLCLWYSRLSIQCNLHIAGEYCDNLSPGKALSPVTNQQQISRKCYNTMVLMWRKCMLCFYVWHWSGIVAVKVCIFQLYVRIMQCRVRRVFRFMYSKTKYRRYFISNCCWVNKQSRTFLWNLALLKQQIPPQSQWPPLFGNWITSIPKSRLSLQQAPALLCNKYIGCEIFLVNVYPVTLDDPDSSNIIDMKYRYALW